MSSIQVLIVEAELKIRRTYKRDFHGSDEEIPDNSAECGTRPEMVVLDIQGLSGSSRKTPMARVLSEGEALAVILSPMVNGEAVEDWSAEACVMNSTTLELLKDAIELRNAEDDTVVLPSLRAVGA